MRIVIATNRTLLAKLRGQGVRPTQMHRNRRQEQWRMACRRPVNLGD